MKSKWLILVALVCLILTSCGGKEKTAVDAELFKEAKSDAVKVALVMKSAKPDSVARFICNTALGLNKGVTIDTLQNAVLYAYEHYKDEDLMKFSEEFDRYSSSLPLAMKMKILSLAALTDPDGLGYKLGLEYAVQIRDKKMTLSDIDKEMESLKKACEKDSDTYIRVLNGLSVALSMPEFSSLPQSVRDKYGKAPRIKVKHPTVTYSVPEVDATDTEVIKDTTSID